MLAIKRYYFWFQHDQQFVDGNVESKEYKYVYDLPQFKGAPFFIRKFNNDTHLTAEQLRREEHELLSTLYSDISDVRYSRHISDYYRLCGGKQLVSCFISIRFQRGYINSN